MIAYALAGGLLAFLAQGGPGVISIPTPWIAAAFVLLTGHLAGRLIGMLVSERVARGMGGKVARG